MNDLSINRKVGLFFECLWVEKFFKMVRFLNSLDFGLVHGVKDGLQYKREKPSQAGDMIIYIPEDLVMN